MTSPDSLLLDRGSYYAPIPVLAVDARGIICDFNVALRVLMHPDIEHARSRPVDELTGDIADHIEGDLFLVIYFHVLRPARHGARRR